MRKEEMSDSSKDSIRRYQFTDKGMWGALLGIERPWQVSSAELEIGGQIPGRSPNGCPAWLLQGTVRVWVSYSRGGKVKCPRCGASCARHDHRERSWRHLDTMQFATLVTVAVPQVKCEKHGVHELSVPWAEDTSRFTAR